MDKFLIFGAILIKIAIGVGLYFLFEGNSFPLYIAMVLLWSVASSAHKYGESAISSLVETEYKVGERFDQNTNDVFDLEKKISELEAKLGDLNFQMNGAKKDDGQL